MKNKTHQMEVWSSDFGRRYTDRNTRTVDEMNQAFYRMIGFSRAEINQDFIDDLNPDGRVLEVGCNIGLQLGALQNMGFNSLHGLDYQNYAVEKGRQQFKKTNFIQGSAFDIPFKPGFFEMVFTSTLLIHIHPNDIVKVLGEMHRCSARYIWGYEFWAPGWTEVNYRGEKDMLWKTDFPRLWCEHFSNLKLIKERKFPHKENPDEIDVMYLLEKTI